MREANGVLTLGPGDLNLASRKKSFKDVQYTDISDSIEPFRHASVVIFVDDEKGKIKIMKSKYKIVQ